MIRPRRLFLLLALLAPLAFGQTLTSFSPVRTKLPGRPGDWVPATFTSLAYDTANRCGVVIQMYLDATTHPQTIYNNDYSCLHLNPGATPDTLQQIAVSNWRNLTPSAGYTTVPNADNAANPTPPDRHANYGVRNGKVWLFHGLNNSIRDTVTFDPGDVNTGTGVITPNRAVSPWFTRDPIMFLTSGGLPSPLVAGTVYYMIRVSGTTFRVATSMDNAKAGTGITLTTQGTGTHRVYRAVDGNGWHPSDTWTIDYPAGTFTQIFVPDATGWHRGSSHGQPGNVVWHGYWNKFVHHYGKNAPATPEYSWTYDPATNTPAELSSTGNKRSGLSPEVWSGQAMTYDRNLKRVWNFGDQDTTNGNFEGAGSSLWYLDTTGAWVETTPEATRPRMIRQHCVEFIPGLNQIVVAGGRRSATSGPNTGEIWFYNPAASAGSRWTLSDQTIPSPSAHTYCYYDRHEGALVIQAESNWYYMLIGEPDLAPPTITLDPVDQTVNAGATAEFTCAASALPTYQWQKNGVNVSDGTGGTTATYTTAATTAADNGAAYRCIATNGFGADTSAAATLTVISPSGGGSGPRRKAGIGLR